MAVYLIITVLFFFCIIMLMRLYLIKKDLRSIRADLEKFDGDQFKKKLDISSNDRDIEAVAILINKKFDEFNDAIVHCKNTEYGLKQAVANMSHDLRTPLTSVLGYLQLLKADISNKEGCKHIEVAERRARTLETLINDFFELSLIESPDYPIELASVDLNALLTQTLADYYESFRTRGIEPAIDLPGKPLKVCTNQSALNRVLGNLLNNVLQHSSQNVFVRLSENSKEAILIISNTAENLTENDVSNLFDRFFTADKVRNSGNTGLGLPIAKALAEKAGGQISASLSGSMLTIQLRLKRILYA